MNACCICLDKINQPIYNLKESKSVQGQVFLISILETIVKTQNFNIDHITNNSNICLKCYELFNEIEQFELKLLEACNKLKYLICERYGSETLKAETTNLTINDANQENLEIKNSEFNLLPNPESNIDQNNKYLKPKESSNLIRDFTTYDSVKNFSIKDCLIESKIYKYDCSDQINSLPDLQNQVKIHELKFYICEICGHSFKKKTSFNVHMKSHKVTHSFTCTFCNKSFTQKISLMRHLPIHTGEKPYQCDECGKCFIHHTSFKIHKLTHTDEKSYKCESCGECFRSSSHLKRHSKIHTGEKKFQCDICGRKFAEKYNLVAHQKVHNGNNTNASVRKRNYSCQMCAETFDRRNKLEEHKIEKHLTTVP